MSAKSNDWFSKALGAGASLEWLEEMDEDPDARPDLDSEGDDDGGVKVWRLLLLPPKTALSATSSLA